MCTTEPKPVFGGISEDFLEEGGWDLMVGITHDSFRDVQLAQATQSTVSKGGLGTVAGVKSSLCVFIFSERSGKLEQGKPQMCLEGTLQQNEW